ncbi:hypothetical protein GCM10023116_34400 [Kistimonas scapharcae]|uniref:Uncharacterized protein n=1 Tax=Kistimonas scapharcae TaxID=1036133 RepID=A0ABP8V5S9_9GAMM
MNVSRQARSDQWYQDALVHFVRVAQASGSNRLEKTSLSDESYDVKSVPVKGELSDVIGVKSLSPERRFNNMEIRVHLRNVIKYFVNQCPFSVARASMENLLHDNERMHDLSGLMAMYKIKHIFEKMDGSLDGCDFKGGLLLRVRRAKERLSAQYQYVKNLVSSHFLDWQGEYSDYYKEREAFDELLLCDKRMRELCENVEAVKNTDEYLGMREFVEKFEAKFYKKTVKRILKGDLFLLPLELRGRISGFEGEVDIIAGQISELNERIEALRNKLFGGDLSEGNRFQSEQETRSDSSLSAISI